MAVNVTNFALASTLSNTLSISADYDGTPNDVTRVRIAVSSLAADVPTGAGSGGAASFTDTEFLAVYDSDDSTIAAPSGATGSYSEDIETPAGAIVFASIAFCDSAGAWSDWQASETLAVAGNNAAPAYTGAIGIQDLITDIRARLATVADIVETFALIDPYAPPPESRFPCVGIKDGSVTRAYTSGFQLRESIQVGIHVYVEVMTAELGDKVLGAGAYKGALEIAEIVRMSLENHTFSDARYFMAECRAEGASEPMLWGSDSRIIQRKELIFNYERIRDGATGV